MSKNGIVLYDIQMDGCLTGVYTNEPADGLIYNEIARKKKESITEKDSPENWNIEGEYTCSWIDINNDREECLLRISRRNDNPRIFNIEWLDGRTRNPRFSGIGYKMNSKQFVVRYE